MKKLFIFVISVISLTSCDQFITRNWGGKTTIDLEAGKRLVEVTWKDDNLWYLVEPMDSDYVPKTKEFVENSAVGVMEGKVIFIEHR